MCLRGTTVVGQRIQLRTHTCDVRTWIQRLDDEVAAGVLDQGEALRTDATQNIWRQASSVTANDGALQCYRPTVQAHAAAATAGGCHIKGNRAVADRECAGGNDAAARTSDAGKAAGSSGACLVAADGAVRES